MAGEGSSVMEQSTAAGVNGDGGALAGERQQEVASQLHEVKVKRTRGLWWSGWVCGGGLTADKTHWSWKEGWRWRYAGNRARPGAIYSLKVSRISNRRKG